MLKRLALIAALLATPADAVLISGGGSAPSSYTGPLDIYSTSVAGWWGLRAANQSEATALAAAINLCNGGTCGDVHVTSTGGLNASDISTLGCNSVNTCTIQTWYDQSGNANPMAQASAGSRATFTNSCLTGLPCAVFASACYESVNNFSTAQPYSSYVIEERTGAFTTQARILDVNAGGAPLIQNNSSANSVGFYGGGEVDKTATDSAWHFFALTANAGAGIVTVDATTSTSSNIGSSAGGGAPMTLGCSNFSFVTNPITGDVVEAGLFGAGWSSTIHASEWSNANTYWTL